MQRLGYIPHFKKKKNTNFPDVYIISNINVQVSYTFQDAHNNNLRILV
jgi:hypothetical protein